LREFYLFYICELVTFTTTNLKFLTYDYFTNIKFIVIIVSIESQELKGAGTYQHALIY